MHQKYQNNQSEPKQATIGVTGLKSNLQFLSNPTALFLTDIIALLCFPFSKRYVSLDSSVTINFTLLKFCNTHDEPNFAQCEIRVAFCWAK
jgi:hypothetical protein